MEEDINGVDGIKRDQKKMLALINSLARNISTPTKISSLQNDIFYNDDNINISKPTLLDYLNVLSKLNIYIEIEAWSPLVRSSIRLRTTTKKILCDTSLAISSLGISEIGLVKDLMTFGHLFERLVLKDLMVNSEANNGKIWYYNDNTDLEIDTIITFADKKWIGIEIKLGNQEIEKASQNLLKLSKKIQQSAIENNESFLPPIFLGVIVGLGETFRIREDGVYIIPYDHLGI